MALLEANQRARLAAQATMTTVFVMVTAVVTVSVSLRNEDIVIALPPATLMLLSFVFQQYADVTVLGAARAALESHIDLAVGRHALIYETVVAPVRKRPPLVRSVRLLQSLAGLLVAGIVGSGAAFAFDHQPALVEIGFTLITLGGLASAWLSYRDMLRSGRVASAALAAALADLDV